MAFYNPIQYYSSSNVTLSTLHSIGHSRDTFHSTANGYPVPVIDLTGDSSGTDGDSMNIDLTTPNTSIAFSGKRTVSKRRLYFFISFAGILRSVRHTFYSLSSAHKICLSALESLLKQTGRQRMLTLHITQDCSKTSSGDEDSGNSSGFDPNHSTIVALFTDDEPTEGINCGAFHKNSSRIEQVTKQGRQTAAANLARRESPSPPTRPRKPWRGIPNTGSFRARNEPRATKRKARKTTLPSSESPQSQESYSAECMRKNPRYPFDLCPEPDWKALEKILTDTLVERLRIEISNGVIGADASFQQSDVPLEQPLEDSSNVMMGIETPHQQSVNTADYDWDKNFAELLLFKMENKAEGFMSGT